MDSAYLVCTLDVFGLIPWWNTQKGSVVGFWGTFSLLKKQVGTYFDVRGHYYNEKILIIGFEPQR